MELTIGAATTPTGGPLPEFGSPGTRKLTLYWEGETRSHFMKTACM